MGFIMIQGFDGRSTRRTQRSAPEITPQMYDEIKTSQILLERSLILSYMTGRSVEDSWRSTTEAWKTAKDMHFVVDERESPKMF